MIIIMISGTMIHVQRRLLNRVQCIRFTLTMRAYTAINVDAQWAVEHEVSFSN